MDLLYADRLQEAQAGRHRGDAQVVDRPVLQIAGLSGSIQTVCVPFAAGLKAHLVGDAGGWVELAFEPASGLVRGAVAVGRHAADVLAPVALALQLGATVEQLGAVYGANPAITELAFIAARTALRPGEGSGS